ncbi:hypothetical protein [Cytobacillus purgationiresistens]|uniref:Uncharacterized protein n=1 Tax=Cytobacillus purgationiresistens TaxID=863449 RepID=A0ABU0AEV9_9BACI|nr:hypothetical protein [Cytobacillus purgationiresistens]MDQ0269792.1 hypothetical protein [Cytobacillus purgationiresistens]
MRIGDMILVSGNLLISNLIQKVMIEVNTGCFLSRWGHSLKIYWNTRVTVTKKKLPRS